MQHRHRGFRFLSVVTACALVLGAVSAPVGADEPKGASTSKAPSTSAAPGSWANVPLSKAAQRGVKWIIVNQNRDGGWSQDGARKGKQPSDVGNTSLAVLAILQTGSTPARGGFQGPLKRGVEFILAEYERNTGSGLEVTARKGTQLQGKIGRYADTFLAARVLLEVDGRMPSKSEDRRVRRALEGVLAKIQRHQAADGSWNQGQSWAPIHSTAYASQALHIAKTRGFKVDKEVLAKVERFTIRQLKEKARAAKPTSPTPPRRAKRRGGRPPVITPSGGSEGVDLGPLSVGGAGILLYSISQGFEQLSRTPAKRAKFAKEIAQIEKKVSDPKVMKGFGSMGGEEFISYVNIAVGMARLGTKDARGWITGLSGRMEKLQNRDGSWSGHHCITGRTAVTGLAVLTLTAERQVPRRTR